MKNMVKRLALLLVAGLAMGALMTSCSLDDGEDYFDEEFLYGRWKNGTEYYRYDIGGSGVTWDTADDVSESEGQRFTWTLTGDELKHIHIMVMGGNVPKVYTVTTLTASTLRYHDSFGKIFTFSKVQ
ncbi:MAG: lipocalin family protein [Tidjanibacter sp.]|nr:lipocalin family protein [Tidjanibacter sp.]MBR4037541.1 lipocalin family protein [Tidjanibacter sp.]MBR4063720.1 lipocalin family protein [Tidjanibacter sp.]